jgi:hypothetical protein
MGSKILFILDLSADIQSSPKPQKFFKFHPEFPQNTFSNLFLQNSLPKSKVRQNSHKINKYLDMFAPVRDTLLKFAESRWGNTAFHRAHKPAIENMVRKASWCCGMACKAWFLMVVVDHWKYYVGFAPHWHMNINTPAIIGAAETNCRFGLFKNFA